MVLKFLSPVTSKHAFKLISVRAFSFKPVSHVIFDIDGLLLKTEDIYEEADRKMISKYGKTYLKEIRMKVLGCTERAAASIIINELKLPITVEQYRHQVDEILDDMLKEATLMDGAERLVKHLHKHKVPIAVATSSGERSVRAKTFNHQELFRLFSHMVMASSDPEIKLGKPAPDVFLACAKRFHDKPEPSKCLVFEDAPNGVTAALRANMQVVMVPEEHVDEKERQKATLTLNSLQEFKPELFNLPSFSD